MRTLETKGGELSNGVPLVPGARHVTNTNSGHEIHKDQPRLVVNSIRDVIHAVRNGKTSLAQ